MKSKNMLATNGKAGERQAEDFYATNPKALEIFLESLKANNQSLHHKVWECAAGQGHLSNLLESKGYEVRKSDLLDRGINAEIIDFLECQEKWKGDILTNPPFNLAEEFVCKGMDCLEQGNKMYLFLKIQFLESKKRKILFEKYPPKYVYINSERQHTAKDGDFDKYKLATLCFCWFVWEKGHNGDTIIKWI